MTDPCCSLSIVSSQHLIGRNTINISNQKFSLVFTVLRKDCNFYYQVYSETALTSRIECKYCLISSSYLAGLFDMFSYYFLSLLFDSILILRLKVWFWWPSTNEDTKVMLIIRYMIVIKHSILDISFYLKMFHSLSKVKETTESVYKQNFLCP